MKQCAGSAGFREIMFKVISFTLFYFVSSDHDFRESVCVVVTNDEMDIDYVDVVPQ